MEQSRAIFARLPSNQTQPPTTARCSVADSFTTDVRVIPRSRPLEGGTADTPRVARNGPCSNARLQHCFGGGAPFGHHNTSHGLFGPQKSAVFRGGQTQRTTSPAGGYQRSKSKRRAVGVTAAPTWSGAGSLGGAYSRTKIVRGFQIADMVRAEVLKGKHARTHVDRLSVRAPGLSKSARPMESTLSSEELLHRADGNASRRRTPFPPNELRGFPARRLSRILGCAAARPKGIRMCRNAMPRSVSCSWWCSLRSTRVVGL
jgi:hypothetical protein